MNADEPEQLSLGGRCPRCGADLAETAHRARLALDRMRLVLPEDLTRGVRALDDCLGGRCIPRRAA
jgi:hypothetical protein